MTFSLRPASLPGSDGPNGGNDPVRRVFEPGGFALPEPLPTLLPPPPAPAAPGPGPGSASRLGALGLPLMLRGDTAPPSARVEGRSDLQLDLGTPGSVGVSRNGAPLTRLPAEFQDSPGGVQGRVMDADGRTLGTFHDGRLHLEPEMARGLDTVVEALAGGAGQPPRTGTTDAGGCEDAPKGEPGRAAGIDPLPPRTPIPGALRADSTRARAMVLRSDPVLNSPLTGLKPLDWQAHHLLTRESAGSAQFSRVFDAAARAGWRQDSPGNLVGLPTNCPAQERLERFGVHRPLHTGSHPDWNQQVIGGLDGVRSALTASRLPEAGAEYQDLARRLLEGLQSRLRHSLGGMDRVVELPHPGTVV